MFVDEDVDSQALKLLLEAGAEMKKLRSNIKKCKMSTQMVKADCDIMEKQIYFNERLNEIKNDAAKKRVKEILLEGDNFDNMTKYEIDERIKEIVEG